MLRSLLFATAMLAGACSSAHADQVAAPMMPGPRTALAIAPAKVRAPYDVQVIRDDGTTMPTYALKDRFYVQGNAGDRYIIRVTNPTPNRVEAVVSVDGLDVVDGEDGDLHKRGYIVPAYGDVRIEGFRTSLDDVATFRFSSVDGSYAGRKGKARNVGVIAVAIFEEQAPPEDQQIIVGATDGKRKGGYDWRRDVDASRGGRYRGPVGGEGDYAGAGADAAKQEPSTPTTTAAAPPAPPPPAAHDAPANGAVAHANGAPATRSVAEKKSADYDYEDDGEDEAATTPAPTHRPGLGTEFGESRYSSATYTKFVRADNRPVAIAELRYNDTAGLMALGIPVAPLPDEGELNTRETADPFPGDSHFATAPR
ncbi:MAG TPA: hypothetical protein VLX92_24350 [Kofleriaceae bacterium]|nr:hypothetical protein [Kofleriaceae bacterium]